MFDPSCPTCHRRAFLRNAVVGSAALFTTPGAFAEKLVATPRMTEGPFYPDKFPLDTDNDLLVINEKITPAVGEITYLSGSVRNLKGEPLPDAVVEIWQVDNNAAYLHTADRNHEKRDTNFQGYGRFLTGRDGGYFFRTIKPVPYPGRTPHIHVAVNSKGKRLLTTQLFVDGHEGNARDGIYRSLENPALVTSAFAPVKGSESGALSARFDIVIGATPDDSKTGLGPRARQRPPSN